MKKIFFLIAVSLFVIQACNNSNKVSEQEFLLKGKFTNSRAEMIYLVEMDVDENILVDSVQIDDNGEFFFKEKLVEPGFYMVKTAEDNFFTLLLDGGETAEVRGDIRNLAETYTVFGSIGSELILQLNLHTRTNYQKLDSLALCWDNHKYSERKSIIRDSLDSIATYIIIDQQHYLLEFMHKNTSSLSTLIAIYQVFARKPMFDEYIHFDLFKEVRDSLDTKYPSNKHVISFKERVDKIEIEIEEKEKIEARLDTGKLAPEISLPGLWTQKTNLSDYKGHVVLVYFWASWDALSRQHNNTVKWLNKTYAPKGLITYAISLDTDKELWQNAVELDELNWVHASDLKYWDSPVVKTYNVNKIPHFVLIDKEGKIFARNFSLEELPQLLYKVFH